MRLVLLGPPGAGKGTQAQVLARRYLVAAISTGELFRATAAEDAELGRAVRTHLAAGRLVPDAVANAMVADRLARADASAGFVLDGFPRTVEQARRLDRMLCRAGVRLDAALALRLDAGEVVRRLTGRRNCRTCGAAWHLEFRPTRRPGRCDGCGGALYQREDDTDFAIRARLSAYRANTMPLLAFYATGGRLIEVEAGDAVERVAAAVAAALERRARLSHPDAASARAPAQLSMGSAPPTSRRNGGYVSVISAP